MVDEETFLRLPEDVLFSILALLKLDDLRNLVSVSRKTKQLLDGQKFWFLKFRETFPRIEVPSLSALFPELNWKELFRDCVIRGYGWDASSCRLLRITNRGLTATHSLHTSSNSYARARLGWKTGRHYFEILVTRTSPNNIYLGICTLQGEKKESSLNPYWLSDALGTNYHYGSAGTLWIGGTRSTWNMRKYGDGTVIGIFIDVENGTVAFYQDKELIAIAQNDTLKNVTVYPAIGLWSEGQSVTRIINPTLPSKLPSPNFCGKLMIWTLQDSITQTEAVCEPPNDPLEIFKMVVADPVTLIQSQQPH